MKILISGAGPAGLSAAYWLKKYGFKPTIIEAGSVLRTGGYKIDVRGSAVQVLQRMAIFDKVVAANTDMQGAKLMDKNGKVICEMTGDSFGHRMGEDQEIVRGSLCQILRDSLQDVEIIFGDSIESIETIEPIEPNESISERTSALLVKFKKNEPRTFDLVIGADGLHSKVRRLVFGEESLFAHEFGVYLCVFTVPNYLNLDRMEIQYTEFGRLAALWSTKGDKTAKATFAFVSPFSVDLKDTAQQQQLLKEVFADISWEVPKLLEFMPTSSDFYFDSVAQIKMDCWSRGRVILLGDAAYCATPMSGQGTSLALIGAYVLAGELALAKGNYKQAFAQFEQEMRPFIKLNQMLGERSAALFKSQQKRGLLAWLLEKIIKWAPGKLLEYIIHQSTYRIHQAANSITLKDYSSLISVQEMVGT